VTYAPGQTPRDHKQIPAFLYGELLKLKSAIASTDGEAVYVGVTEVSAAYTMTLSDYLVLVDTTGGNITITLPDADPGRAVSVKKAVAANTVTIATAGSETIDGSATQTINAQYENVVMVALSGNWYIV